MSLIVVGRLIFYLHDLDALLLNLLLEHLVLLLQVGELFQLEALVGQLFLLLLDDVRHVVEVAGPSDESDLF